MVTVSDYLDGAAASCGRRNWLGLHLRPQRSQAGATVILPQEVPDRLAGTSGRRWRWRSGCADVRDRGSGRRQVASPRTGSGRSWGRVVPPLRTGSRVSTAPTVEHTFDKGKGGALPGQYRQGNLHYYQQLAISCTALQDSRRPPASPLEVGVFRPARRSGQGGRTTVVDEAADHHGFRDRLHP